MEAAARVVVGLGGGGGEDGREGGPDGEPLAGAVEVYDLLLLCFHLGSGPPHPQEGGQRVADVGRHADNGPAALAAQVSSIPRLAACGGRQPRAHHQCGLACHRHVAPFSRRSRHLAGRTHFGEGGGGKEEKNRARGVKVDRKRSKVGGRERGKSGKCAIRGESVMRYGRVAVVRRERTIAFNRYVYCPCKRYTPRHKPCPSCRSFLAHIELMRQKKKERRRREE